jgi:RHS repeat-associated protein
MDGDGLADIVLLHEGRVDYWPNLGYGRFGPRLTMRGLPDPPQLDPGFDPKRLALVDLDGTGCADLVYVDFDRVHFWFNQSGNGWSRRQTIHGTPTVSDADAVRFADVFGTGTATLLWTSDFAFQPQGNCKALDFAGGVKPYLLETIDTNMGATTNFRHAPSTRFAVEAAREGRPWITALPFPVHVVEAVEIVDGLQGTRLLSRYRYRHGYYDGREREFRGFGLVEQVDAETAWGGTGSAPHDSDPAMPAEAHSAAPALSRTWFSLGVPLDDARRERFRREQYREDPAAFDPPPDDVDTGEDPALAYRALRGRPLRVEMFGLDESRAAGHPYTVQEHAYRVTLLQRATATARPVHHVTTRETRTSHYERSPADPRVTQELVLALDGHGNVTDRVSIAYPRRTPAIPEQSALLAAYTRADFVNDVDDVTRHYVGRPCQSRRYEITGMPWSPGAPPLGASDFAAVLDVDLGQSRPFRPFEWERPPGHVGVERRLLSWARNYYRRDGAAAVVDLDPGRSPARTLAERLPLGRIDRLGLPYETYRAALTDDLVTVVYGDLLSQGSASRAAAELEAAGYHREPDVPRYWWIPSGQVAFDPSRFHVAVRRRDAFGRDERVFHDSYALLQTRTVDQVGNERRVELDYRVLAPRALIDQNQNRSEVTFDALGVVTGTAVSGDTLSGFAADLEAAEVDAYLSDPGLAPLDLLRGATTRIVYDPHQFRRFGRPAVVATLAREIHAGAPGGSSTPVQQGFLYSDGCGRALQTRLAAETGPVGGAAASTRWTVTGATVYNNKGKRVEQYEPFFSGTHRFESPRRHGVAQSVFYDPLLRPVLTLHPNHSFEKAVFDAWREEVWDANDTVLLLPEDEPQLAGVLRRHLREHGVPFRSWFDQRIPDRAHPPPPSARAPEQQAALQAAEHAGTPTVTHLDPVGRRCRKVMTTGTAPGSDVLETRYLLDVDGNLRAIVDPRGLSAFVHDVDLAGRRLGVDSRDAGRRRSFLDVVGQAIYEWNGEGLRTRHVFDALRRVTEVWVAAPGGPERLAERAVYGETQPNATIRNLRGRIAEKYDAAGVATFDAYDARGYLLTTTRRLAQDYRREPDWSNAVSLGSEVFQADTAYDALARIVAVTVEETGVTSSRCAYRPRYNPANLLAGVDASAFGDSTPSVALAAIEYDARGQRTTVAHGNGVTTRYAYEPETFRLRSVVSTRSDGFTVRHLEYTYDPVGNLTRVADVAFPSVFHANQQVDAISRYRYDAAYRLVSASGREHEAVGPCHYRQLGRKQTEFLPFAAQPPTDAQALRNYEETYRYDLGDGLVEIVHAAGAAGGWTRRQTVDAASNRLLDSDAGCDGESTFVVPYDRNGNVIALPHLPLLEWDHRDRLRHARVNRVAGGVPDQVYFTYEAAGQRMRKVVERAGRLDEDHLYLGSVEIHRRHSGAGVDFERRTFRVSDDRGPLLLVEQRTVDVAGRESGMPARQVRHQLDDHRGSVLLEVDSAGSPLSYEEFYPYGGSAYLAGAGLRADERRRYRFGGHELDDETGLYYCGARYYAPWLGRWISPDPLGSADALNLYVFARDNPVTFRDLTGHLSEDTKENLKQLGRDMWNDVKAMGTAVKEGVVDTASKASAAAKAGEYSEAAAYVLQVDKLADRAVFYEDQGATGLETAALVLSEKTGMTDALEAYTGESIQGETLSRAERARKGITGVTGVITTATGVAAGISPRVPKIDPPRVRPQRSVGTTVKAKDSLDMGESIPGETRRPATIEEIKRFERSEKEKVEISEVESRTGSKIETTGGPDHVTIRVGPDTKSTHHTHQRSGLAVFSREDINDVILNPSLGDDVVHKVTGRLGPTREALESSGLPIPKIDSEFVTVEVTTALARRAIQSGTLRPIAHFIKP